MARVVSIAVVLQLALASMAAAAEGQDNLFAGDLGNAIWTLVIFAAVILVLGKFAWGPLLSALQQREQFIRDALNQAKADRESAAAQLAEYTEQIRKAKTEATEIVEEGRRDAEALRRKIEAETRAEADRTVERARREVDLAKQTAIKEIYESGARLATQAAGQVLRREVSAADHERLIAEAIRDLAEPPS